MQLSVLLSVYYKENAAYFDIAMSSIWDKQTTKPDQIVLVQDGKLTDELYSIINQWQKKLSSVLKVIALKNNVGLGDALQIGLTACQHELVARMDTDDIAHPERFEKQIKIFKDSNVDVCSSWINEFKQNENEIVAYRKLPEYHNDIIKFAKTRNPINHPACMFKKSIIQLAGSYQKMMYFEDYYLWVRVILLDKAIFYNIQQPLVNMRGACHLQRRSGWNYAIDELKFLTKLKSLGFLNYWEFITNLGLRFITRLAPKMILKAIYKLIRN